MCGEECAERNARRGMRGEECVERNVRRGICRVSRGVFFLTMILNGIVSHFYALVQISLFVLALEYVV